jgi:tetratricopeptide (TPR) repeat protein
MLCDGYVNSYVDFFYLTHRLNDQQGDSLGNPDVASLNEAEMESVKTLLIAAEAAQRRSDTAHVIDAYTALADIFSEKGDHKTAVYFLDKRLAEAGDDLAQQSDVCARLADEHDALGQLDTRIKYLEQEVRVSQEMEDEARRVDASRRLAATYLRKATGLGEGGDPQESIQLFERCLRTALEGGDADLERRAAQAIGTACARLGAAAEAREWHERGLGLARGLGDAEAECEALLSLGTVLLSLGEPGAAVAQFELCRELSARRGMPAVETEVCTRLGDLLMDTGDAARALGCLERAYTLARDTGDRARIDAARVRLGVARGSRGVEAYGALLTANKSAKQ